MLRCLRRNKKTYQRYRFWSHGISEHRFSSCIAEKGVYVWNETLCSVYCSSKCIVLAGTSRSLCAGVQLFLLSSKRLQLKLRALSSRWQNVQRSHLHLVTSYRSVQWCSLAVETDFVFVFRPAGLIHERAVEITTMPVMTNYFCVKSLLFWPCNFIIFTTTAIHNLWMRIIRIIFAV